MHKEKGFLTQGKPSHFDIELALAIDQYFLEVLFICNTISLQVSK